MPECNFQARSLQASWPDDRLLSTSTGYCTDASDTCEGRTVSNSFLNHQSPTVYHTNQDTSSLHHRQGEVLNPNHLLMSPSALPFAEDEHRIFRMDKIDRNSKDCGMSNSSISTVSLHSVSRATNTNNQYYGEGYFESPTMAMIDSINTSGCYSAHHQQYQPAAPQPNSYDDLGDRSTVPHNAFDATAHESYSSMQPIHLSSTATTSEVSSSLAEDSLSSSTVAVYHFNNTLIDFTNPSDIFQFDRAYSSSTAVDGPTDPSACSYQQNQEHYQHQSISPTSNQGKLLYPPVFRY